MCRFALASLLLLLVAVIAHADGNFCADAHYLAYETPARAMGEVVHLYIVMPDAGGVARRARVTVPGSAGMVVGLRCRAATLDVLTRHKLFVYNVTVHGRLAPKLAHRVDLENAVSFRPGSGYFEGNLEHNDRILPGDPKVTFLLPWKAGKAEYSIVITQRQREKGCGNHIVAKLVRAGGRKSRSLVLWSYDNFDECCDG